MSSQNLQWGYHFVQWIIRTTGVWVSVAGLLLTFAALKGSYIDPKLPEFFYKIVLWLGFGVSAAIISAFAINPFLARYAADVVDAFRFAKREELQEVLPFYDRVVGGERPGVNALKDLYNANNHSFLFYERSRLLDGKKRTELLGFCTIIPVSDAADTLLGNEQLNGLKLNKEHVVKPGGRCSAIYIGSVGAEKNWARAAILNYMLGQMHRYAENGVRRVYTRPVTLLGLKTAKRHGFQPVKNDAQENELYRLYMFDLSSFCPKDYVRINRRLKKITVPNP